MKRFSLLGLVVVICGLGNIAFADCANPAGKTGAMMYASNFGVMVYCNGSTWMSVGGSTDSRIGTLTANKWCVANSTGSGFDCTTNAPVTAAAGANTQVQFNSSNAFAGSANFTWNTGTNTLTATNISGTLAAGPQANISAVGTLTGLTVNGTVTGTTFSGSGALLTNIPASAITGLAAAAVTDRIVSTSANVVAGNGGTISFTTGGVSGTAYIDTVGRLVAAGVSTTGAVSAVTVAAGDVAATGSVSATRVKGNTVQLAGDLGDTCTSENAGLVRFVNNRMFICKDPNLAP